MAEVVSPQGTVGTIPDEALEEALGQGYRLAGEGEHAGELRRQKYGGAVNAAGAFGVGALNELTLGLGEAGLAHYGGADMRDRLQGYREYQPLARGAGQLLGMVAPAFATGGGSLGASGAKAAAGQAAKRGGRGMIGRALAHTPAGMLNRAGDAAGRAAGGGFARQMAVGGMVEGGLSAIGDEFAEAKVYDREITGERLAIALATGTAVGGGLGLGIGGAMDIGSKAFAKVLGRTVGGNNDPGILAKTSALLTGADEKMLYKHMRMDATGRATRDATHAAGDAHEAFEGALNKDLNALVSNEHVGTESFRDLSMKTDLVNSNIIKGNEDAVHDAALDILDRKIANFDDVTTSDIAHAKDLAFTEIRGEALAARKSIVDARAGLDGGNAKTFIAMDRFKRAEGAYTDTVKKYARNKLPKAVRSSEIFSASYEETRQFLHSTELFGDAAKMQAEINGAWHKSISHRGALKKNFLADFGKEDYDNWVTKQVADPSKIQKAARNLVNPKGDLTFRSLEEYVSGIEARNVAWQKWGDLTPKELAASTAQLEAVKSIRATREAAEGPMVLKNELRKLEESGKDGGLLAGLMGGAAAVGSPVGIAGTAALSAVFNPAKFVHQLGSVERMAAKVGGDFSKTSGKLMKGAKKIPKAVARVGTQGTLGLREYKRSVAFAKAHRDNPEQSEMEYRAGLGGVEEHAPEAVDKAVEVEMKKRAYLEKFIPDERAPSEAEMALYKKIYDTLQDPTDLLRDVTMGQFDMDAAKAVRDVFPEVYGDMQFQLIDSLSTLEADGKQLPFGQRMSLGLAFDIPTDDMLEPEMIDLLQKTYEGMAKPDPNGPPGDMPGPPGPPGPPEEPGPSVVPQTAKRMQQMDEREGM